MTPEGAATMLYEMPEDQMVRALFSLKPDNAGLILEALSKQGKEQAKRAANATDRLRTVLPP
jgi:flagellar motility protein MotE (MotC chaperone)